MATGKFITLEGGEGTGKSTQAQLLATALRARGLDILVTREPGGTPGADQIRALLVEGEPDRWSPISEALLHFAARSDHVARRLKPALAAGQWIVCDRFTDSTMAYQGYGHALGPDLITRLRDIAVGDFTPDLTLILDIEVDAGLARATARDGAEGAAGRYEKMDRDFHERMRAGFHEIAEGDPGRCVLIEADASIDAVAARVLAKVEEQFFSGVV